MTGLKLLYLIVGVIMVVYALYAHLILPGIPFALLIIGGLLLIWSALGRGKLL